MSAVTVMQYGEDHQEDVETENYLQWPDADAVNQRLVPLCIEIHGELITAAQHTADHISSESFLTS